MFGEWEGWLLLERHVKASAIACDSLNQAAIKYKGSSSYNKTKHLLKACFATHAPSYFESVACV